MDGERETWGKHDVGKWRRGITSNAENAVGMDRGRERRAEAPAWRKGGKEPAV